MTINENMDFGVKALVLNETKFLAMHKTGVKENLYELPGGRMEFGETAEETLIREIREELGLIVKPIKLLDTWNLMLRVDYQIAGIIYLAEVEDGVFKLSSEHDGYKWLEIGEKSFELMYPVFRDKMKKWDWDEIKILSSKE